MIALGTPPALHLDVDSQAPGTAIVSFIEAGPRTVPSRLPAWTTAHIAAARASGEFTGRGGELLLLHGLGQADPQQAQPHHPQHVLLAGLGAAQAVTVDGLRRAAAAATRRLLDCGLARWHLHVPDLPDIDASARTQAVTEGVLLASYAFRAYVTGATGRQPSPRLDAVTLWAPDTVDPRPLQEGLDRGRLVGEAVWLARDLCNHPGNELTPARFVATATAVADEEGLQATLIDAQGLAEAGMGGLLAVGAGSTQPPALLVLDYQPAGVAPDHPLVLVGKTVTFDSGGISLKVALDMEQMKADMTGGAAVLAALRAAARAGLRRRIVAIFAIVENMPGGHAMRPGDILRMASGTTVEVLNTDAEGRLILADALHHARQFQPCCVIDVATLTGASAIVFGDAFNALFSTAPDYAHRMRAAGDFSGEPLWPMPLAADYAERLRSDVADLRNVAGQRGGMLIAAAFLQHFAADLPWLHLDVYNTCWNTGNQPWLSKGATGGGTRVLTQFLLDLATADDPASSH